MTRAQMKYCIMLMSHFSVSDDLKCAVITKLPMSQGENKKVKTHDCASQTVKHSSMTSSHTGNDHSVL